MKDFKEEALEIINNFVTPGGERHTKDLAEALYQLHLEGVRDIKEIVYSCLYDEYVERGHPENWEAGKFNVTKFDEEMEKLKK